MPSAVRVLASFPPSIAPPSPVSPIIAASGPCSREESPRMCIYVSSFISISPHAASNPNSSKQEANRESGGRASKNKARSKSTPRRMKRLSSRQQSTQAQQQKTRLLQTNAPQDFPGFVPRVVAQ